MGEHEDRTLPVYTDKGGTTCRGYSRGRGRNQADDTGVSPCSDRLSVLLFPGRIPDRPLPARESARVRCWQTVPTMISSQLVPYSARKDKPQPRDISSSPWIRPYPCVSNKTFHADSADWDSSETRKRQFSHPSHHRQDHFAVQDQETTMETVLYSDREDRGCSVSRIRHGTRPVHRRMVR